jgi:hypothetical protein
LSAIAIDGLADVTTALLRLINTADHDLQGKPPSVPRSIVLPSLKSGLVLVALTAIVAFGFGRLFQMPADLSLDAEIAAVEQIIAAPIEQDVLGPPAMSALDSESTSELSSRWTHPAKHPVTVRRSRSPRRGGPRSVMPGSLLLSTFRPEKQLPAPADARSAMSGEPVAVFVVLRN